MLEKFRKAKSAEVAALQELAGQGRLPKPYGRPLPGFCASLKKAGKRPVIAEYKRASPSKGDINLGLVPEQAALAYARAGAGALSVLTEETWFKGSLSFLERMTGPGLPLLRKDFIIHPLQVAQTAASPASAMLLIVRMLDDSLLHEIIGKSRDFGLEPVVEVFDEEDLRRAHKAGADIIQVNNRDLDTLRVDLDNSRRLVRHKRGGDFWISASGIETPAQLDGLLGFGFDAALIGSALMDASRPGSGPGENLAALLEAGE